MLVSTYTATRVQPEHEFNIDTEGAVYSVTVFVTIQATAPFGDTYLHGDTITVLGNRVGGATPANDLNITIDNVDGSGVITAVSATGTAYNGNSLHVIVGNNRLGAGATLILALQAERIHQLNTAAALDMV